MAIHHDVDLVTHGLSHRGHIGFGPPNGRQAFERHGFGDGHRFERGVAVFDGLLSQFRETFVVVAARSVEVFHPAATEMGVGADPVTNWSTP